MACRNCGETSRSTFCPACGQDSREPPRKYASLAAYVLAHATGFEGKAPTSIFALLFRPGRLTLDYVEGRRVRHVSPVQLYLWCTAAFFLVHAYSPFVRVDHQSGAVVSTLSAVSIGTELSPATREHLAQQGADIASFAPSFDAAVSAYLPVLLVGLVVAFVALLAMQFLGEDALTHVTFALHWTAFYFVLETVRKLLYLPRAWGIGASMAATLIALVYLAIAMRTVYRRSWLGSAVRALTSFLVFIALVGIWLWSTSLLGERLA